MSVDQNHAKIFYIFTEDTYDDSTAYLSVFDHVPVVPVCFHEVLDALTSRCCHLVFITHSWPIVISK